MGKLDGKVALITGGSDGIRLAPQRFSSGAKVYTLVGDKAGWTRSSQRSGPVH
jgi:NAD(P)-dependent dehydrogenase (short-subunit alcohol dehydrogenase family)